MTTSENYDELADRLTGDSPVKGKGTALHGEEAAAYGRRMIANALSVEQLPELPSDFAVLLAELTDVPPPKLYRGAVDKTVIPPAESQ